MSIMHRVTVQQLGLQVDIPASLVQDLQKQGYPIALYAHDEAMRALLNGPWHKEVQIVDLTGMNRIKTREIAQTPLVEPTKKKSTRTYPDTWPKFMYRDGGTGNNPAVVVWNRQDNGNIYYKDGLTSVILDTFNACSVLQNFTVIDGKAAMNKLHEFNQPYIAMRIDAWPKYVWCSPEVVMWVVRGPEKMNNIVYSNGEVLPDSSNGLKMIELTLQSKWSVVPPKDADAWIRKHDLPRYLTKACTGKPHWHPDALKLSYKVSKKDIRYDARVFERVPEYVGASKYTIFIAGNNRPTAVYDSVKLRGNWYQCKEEDSFAGLDTIKTLTKEITHTPHGNYQIEVATNHVHLRNMKCLPSKEIDDAFDSDAD